MPPLYRYSLLAIGLGFAAAFCAIVVPPLLRSLDVWGAFAAGFVNPYASGYALDTICCWGVLAVWVLHDARVLGVRHGWLCLLLGLAPGVATGFAVYLLMRSAQVREQHAA